MDRRTRRTIPILALLVWLAGLGPAGAHTCMTPARVVVGQPSVLNIAVPAEGITPLVAIDLHLPAEFELDEAPPLGGWQAAVDGQVVHLFGNEVMGGACAYVALKGVATRKGTMAIPIHTRDDDGTERDLTGTDPQDPRAGQLVDVIGTTRAEGTGWTPAGLGAVAAGGLVAAAGVWRWRRRRWRRAGGSHAS